MSENLKRLQSVHWTQKENGSHIQLSAVTLQWRHNGRDSVSNHQLDDCLLNRYSYADQRKHQSSASLAFVRGSHRGPVNSPHKWPVTRKMFPFYDIIMKIRPNTLYTVLQCQKRYIIMKIVTGKELHRHQCILCPFLWFTHTYIYMPYIACAHGFGMQCWVGLY